MFGPILGQDGSNERFLIDFASIVNRNVMESNVDFAWYSNDVEIHFRSNLDCIRRSCSSLLFETTMQKDGLLRKDPKPRSSEDMKARSRARHGIRSRIRGSSSIFPSGRHNFLEIWFVRIHDRRKAIYANLMWIKNREGPEWGGRARDKRKIPQRDW